MPREEWIEVEGGEIHIDRLTHSDPSCTVMMLHGGGGNGRVLMPLGRIAHRAGAEVVAPDLPGYGLSVRKRGYVPTYDHWADIAAAIADKEHRRTGRPVIVWGLSLGGLLSYGTAARSEAVGGVIATTLLDTRRPANLAITARSKVMGYLSAALLPILPQFLRRVRVPIRWVSKMEHITNTPELSAVFSRDPLAGGAAVPLGFLRSLLRFDLRIEPEDFTRCPVLVVHPAIDPWIPAKYSRSFFNALACQKEWIDLIGCGHLPFEEPGVKAMEDGIVRFLGRIVG
ncbi:MAG: alpha/beta hydrolase [Spirochaetales bacterium]|nr:alpha/beta hydrolase [Spirochaetales bacterium]